VDKIFSLIIKHPWLALLLSFLISLPFLFFLPLVKTVENVDYFTLEGDPDVAYYKNFKNVFGNDEFFLIAFKDKDIFTKENLTLIRDISSRLEQMDDVRKVISLSTVSETIGEEDYFLVQDFLHEIPEDKAALKGLKQKAIQNPLYRDSIISKDGSTAAIVVLTHERPEDEAYRKRLIHKTSMILHEYEGVVNRTFHIAGWTVTNLRLSEYMKKDVARFIPVVYLMIMLVIFFLFRNVKIAFLAFLNISLCLSCTMGFLAMIGATLNNVTTIIPPLIMALSLADTIHVFTHYLSNKTKDGKTENALLKALLDVYKPCLLTSATTVAGFLSLRLSHIPPIQEFALISSMGIVLAFIFSFLFLPALTVLFSPSSGYRENDSMPLIDHILNTFIMLNRRHGNAILIVCSLLTIIAIFLGTRITVETNLVEFFKRSLPLRQSLSFVEENLSGTETINISIKGNAKDIFKVPKNVLFLETLQKYIASLPEIDMTNSLVDFIKDMNESFHNEDTSYYSVPETREMIAQYLLLYDSDDIDDFINPSFDHARIIARTNRHSTSEIEMIIRNIETFLREKTPATLEARVTGETRQRINIASDMVSGQVKSLSLAVIVISVLMFVVFRSFSLGLLSMLPNVFPIILNFGIMGALGIHLSTATSLISAVAIGIAVDDTIHFLHKYKKERTEERGTHEAIQNTIRIKGKAMLTTSVILASAFGTLTLSSFMPTLQFGSLTALIMISALAGDLLLLPAILGIRRKRSR
jgi:predicted RND superfamily exporter protein